MTVRLFLAVQAAVFDMAAMVHSGFLVHGYEHLRARNAESVIGAVLLLALLCTAILPRWVRPIALGAQGFALLGTLVGLSMIAIGVGPRTFFDLTLHAAMVTLLVVGLLTTHRAPAVARS
jgi:hypothetical protein